ncbi:MAG: hypothetical protein ACI4A8_02280 [Muribaculaceae bacterium]
MANKKIFIFNPENDMALAFGGDFYTPPPLPAMLRHDLRLLPIWMADTDDAVMANSVPVEWIRRTTLQINGVCTNIATRQDLSNADHSFSPWGWSTSLRRELVAAGANDSSLPSRDRIEQIRELSHRRSSIIIHNAVNQAIGYQLAPTPVELHSFETVRQFAAANPGCFLKAPWSSSGKGIFRVVDADALALERWCSGVLRRQGSILAEKPLDSLLDFAMEFKIDNGKASFIGYSVFANNSQSSFSSCIIGSESHLESLIVDVLGDATLLGDVRDALCPILEKLIGTDYSGFLGIDMMVYSQNGTPQLCPCIELNLRCTMGVVAAIISGRFVAPGTTGSFHVDFFKDPDELKANCQALKAQNPARIEHGRMVSGFFELTPIESTSQYIAYLILHK